MAPKRPAPLSDEAFNKGPPRPTLQPATPAQAQNPPPQHLNKAVETSATLGLTNNGLPLPVKNTFIDVPSGMTPTGMMSGSALKSQMLKTAPADLNQQPGFMQRAIAASIQQEPPTSTQATVVPMPSPCVARFLHTPMATPSPSSTAMVMPHGSTMTTGFAAALAAAGGGTGPMPSAYPSTAFPASTAPTAWSVPTPASAFSYASLPPGPLTYAIAPGVKAAGPSPPYPGVVGGGSVGSSTSPLYSQSLLYQRPVTAEAPPNGNLDEAEDEEEDGEDDSDGELAVPPHLRAMQDAPKPPPGAVHPSIGSEAHALGQCKRCCFFPRGRCTNGYNCEFCHYEHEKRKRKNKNKKKKKADGGATAVAATSPAVANFMPTQVLAGRIGEPLTQLQRPVGGLLPMHGSALIDPRSGHSVQRCSSMVPTAAVPVALGYGAAAPIPQQAPAPAHAVQGFMAPPFHLPSLTQVFDASMPPPHVFEASPPLSARTPRISLPGGAQTVYAASMPPPPPLGSPQLPRSIQQTLVHTMGQMAGLAPVGTPTA
eukprot:TRINITY_DN959_c2_g1_i1.p1 TRINITY_DN959_c2_g1~~TRINITY_DN959_c2_g1_i1.p1  ORF type:complete len:548 (-),score=110.93 TRINITY_DN959_c2_g1_i1:71-1690(-)